MATTVMAYNIYDIHPETRALPDEAQRIETMRDQLVLDSEEIRRGNDHQPDNTTIRLAQLAILLASSKAPMFEKLHTLNRVHANLLAGGMKRRNMRTIAGLSRKALRVAYPRTKDRATNQLNHTDIAVRRRAIRNTSPTFPFPDAMEEAWQHLGHPIDPLIRATDQKVIDSLRANARQRRQRHIDEATGTLVDPLPEEIVSVPVIPSK